MIYGMYETYMQTAITLAITLKTRINFVSFIILFPFVLIFLLRYPISL